MPVSSARGQAQPGQQTESESGRGGREDQVRERREREQGGSMGTKRSREEAGTSRAGSQMSEFI